MPRRIAAIACFVLLVALGTAKLAAYQHVLAGTTHPAGIACGAVALALLWTSLLPARPRWWIAVWCGQTIWLAVNWGYANYFAAPLWLGTVLGAGGVGALAVGHGALPVSLAMWWLVADLPVLVGILVLRLKPTPWRSGAVAAATLALLLIALTAWAWWQLPAHESDPERIHPVSELVARVGPLPVQLADALRGRGPDPQPGPAAEVRPSLPGGERRSVLLIQVESLDAGAMEWKLADGRPAMPRLTARAAGGTLWTHCLAYHGSGGSSDGEFAVVDGCEPTWNAPVVNRRGYLFPHALPKRLGEQGWDCAMMLGLYGFFFDYSRIQPRVGYRWYGLEELGVVQRDDEFGARDGEFVDAVLARLDGLRPPFLLHCTTMSGHVPWRQWRHIPACAGPDLAASGTADDYARTLRYVDEHLDRLIAGFLDRCPDGVVVLFGDHSAMIDAVGYASPVGRQDGVQWEFVPALILGHGVPARRVAMAAASQLDVQRTVLAAAGWHGSVPSWGMDLVDPKAPAPPLRFHGRSYDRAVIAGWAATLGRH